MISLTFRAIHADIAIKCDIRKIRYALKNGEFHELGNRSKKSADVIITVIDEKLANGTYRVQQRISGRAAKSYLDTIPGTFVTQEISTGYLIEKTY